MARKFISLATAIVILDVYLRSQLYSNDPLFLFASNQLVVNLGLLAVAGLLIGVSFRDKFKHWLSFAACAAGAVAFSAIGLFGLFASSVMYNFSNVFLPLDYAFILQAGVILGICALSYQHGSSHKLKQWRQASLLPSIKSVFPDPKIPHSPTRLSRTSAPEAN